MLSPTEAIADAYSPNSLSARMRARRWRMLTETFGDLSEARVVDVGGDARHWASAPVRPREVVLLNLYDQAPAEDWIRVVVGDACDVPDALRGESFDLVYSNSTIEHVGGHWRRQRFADTVHALGERHWVQTPNRYFPVEPHWLFPGFQFLPLSARAMVMKRWPLGYEHKLWREGLDGDVETPAAHREAVEQALFVELLSETAMKHYFPDSDVRVESALGLAKSLIAVRT